MKMRIVALLIAAVVLCFGARAMAQAPSQGGPTSAYPGGRYTRYPDLNHAVCDDKIAANCILEVDGTNYVPGLVPGQGRTRREIAIANCKLAFTLRLPVLVRSARAPQQLVDLFTSTGAPRASGSLNAACLKALGRRDFDAQMRARDAAFEARRRAAAAAAASSATVVARAPAPSPTYVMTPEEAARLKQLEAALEAESAGTHAAPSKPATPPAAKPAAKPAARPVVARVRPATAPSDWCGLGDNLQLVSVNDTDVARIRVLPGAQFASVQHSCIAKKFNVEWGMAYADSHNSYKNFIGACFMPDRKVELDTDRMSVKSWDKVKLDGPVDVTFMKGCEAKGGEFRFALQAGQVITLSAKNSESESQPTPPTVSAPNEAPDETPPLEAESIPAPSTDPTTNPMAVASAMPPVPESSAGSPAPVAPLEGAVVSSPTASASNVLPPVNVAATRPAPSGEFERAVQQHEAAQQRMKWPAYIALMFAATLMFVWIVVRRRRIELRDPYIPIRMRTEEGIPSRITIVPAPEPPPLEAVNASLETSEELHASDPFPSIRPSQNAPGGIS
ncbi:MAG: hypothetical protein PHS79_05640 [Patescibacteria group bacterium]|nr:hypothetical protein [Patescibacteria group bacterium]